MSNVLQYFSYAYVQNEEVSCFIVTSVWSVVFQVDAKPCSARGQGGSGGGGGGRVSLIILYLFDSYSQVF